MCMRYIHVCSSFRTEVNIVTITIVTIVTVLIIFHQVSVEQPKVDSLRFL